MSLHPLIDLAQDREVRRASGFRAAAAELTGEALEVHYRRELDTAPRRHAAGKRHLGGAKGRAPGGRRSSRDNEHFSIALASHGREHGALELPGEGTLEPLAALVPLVSAAPDRSLGAQDPNRGVGCIDLLALGPEDRLAVVVARFVAPSSSRTGVGDTPLRALLQGLAHVAIADANRAELREEVGELCGREPADQSPTLIFLASPRYWELCRKREAQKGAAWIKEMERLGREIDEQLGVPIRYLAARLAGDPGWTYPDGWPVLDAAPELLLAWEQGAGRVRPKPRPQARESSVDQVIEPDLSRPVRSYALTESYAAGDRIDHPTLGSGVVQGSAGPGKIHVLFEGKRSLLVHGRGAASI